MAFRMSVADETAQGRLLWSADGRGLLPFHVCQDSHQRTQGLQRGNRLEMKNIGESVVRIEAEALSALADRIGGPMAAAFQRAVDLMFCCAGRVVVTGMGKSGLIARKIAATLSSTGTPALYLHPVEALHGDLGMVVRGDVVLALSASGETGEILALLATIKRLQVALITMTGDPVCDVKSSDSPTSKSAMGGIAASISTLASAADVALDCSIAQEACALGLAPTASTTTMLALGDALAVTLSERRGFKEEDFADLHPAENWESGWPGLSRSCIPAMRCLASRPRRVCRM